MIDSDAYVFSGAGRINKGYAPVIIEVVGRNHAPTFPRCAAYSREAGMPEETRGAQVIQVSNLSPLYCSHEVNPVLFPKRWSSDYWKI